MTNKELLRKILSNRRIKIYGLTTSNILYILDVLNNTYNVKKNANSVWNGSANPHRKFPSWQHRDIYDEYDFIYFDPKSRTIRKGRFVKDNERFHNKSLTLSHIKILSSLLNEDTDLKHFLNLI